VLRVGVAKYCRGEKTEVFTFQTVDVLWDYIENKLEKDEKIILIAHNIQFDLHVLRAYETLRNRGYKAEGIIIDDETDKIFLNRWMKNGKVLYGFDNMQVYNCSVKKIGKKLGIIKPEIYDFETATMDEITNRCIIDVEIVMSHAPKVFTVLNKILEKKDCISATSSLEQNIMQKLRWRNRKENVMPCGLDKEYAGKEHAHCAYPSCFGCSMVFGNDVKCPV